MPALNAVVDWLDERTGFASGCRRFFREEIPTSTGWAQVFGSVALFLFLLQALTGLLLALNYAATPGDAYHSLNYIMHQVVAGRMIRGLHHWGASLMVIVVFLHMAQVFIYAAYRKPREATWIAGVLLLFLTLAFGLTGYLLPWDNRAYWGTVVTTRIMGSVPFAGPILLRLAGASDGVGVLTFARFYALHTILLPAATLSLIAIHVWLVRRHGVTPKHPDEPRDQTFYPRQAFRDLVAVSVVFGILFVTAALADVPLERLADPTDTSYTPRPEWYFLYLFQMLRMLSGPLEILGSAGLPALAVAALFAIPFIRRRRDVFRYQQRNAAVVVLIVFVLWGGLTAAAIRTAPRPKRPASVTASELRWAQISPEEIAGIGYFYSARCGSCHNLVDGEPKLGPNLMSAGRRHPKEWLAQHYASSSSRLTATHHFSIPELNSLSLFIGNLNPESSATLQEMSPQFIKGAQTYVASACGSCHKVNGIGGGIGPPLNGLAERRSKEWVSAHFRAPQKLSPGSIMPPYRFSSEEQECILLYLFSLSE
jgi:ubiquinol-cytochrome c reductase cytochrome b subunit